MAPGLVLMEQINWLTTEATAVSASAVAAVAAVVVAVVPITASVGNGIAI